MAGALVTAALCGCGGNPAATPAGPAPAPSSVSGTVAADAGASRYHPMHRAAFGPIYASGCPTNGACACGKATDLGEEFDCQLDHLAAADIPITAYLFDGSAWSKGHSSPENTCQGPDCCSWRLGDQVIERLSREGIRGLLHFWGGCHEPAQYRARCEQPGEQAARLLPRRRLLGREPPGSRRVHGVGRSQRLGGRREGDPEPRASHDARRPRALGQRRLRRRPAGRLRRAQGGHRETAGRRAPRARAVRRAHRLRHGRRDSERGGLLPAPALRGAPAGDGALPVRQRRPLASRVRTRAR